MVQLQANQAAKMEVLERAAYEHEVYLNHIEVLKSVHKDCTDPLDWESMTKFPEPGKPVKHFEHERRATEILDKYKPGFLDRVLKREKIKRTKLKNDVELAKGQDEVDYQRDYEKWEAELGDWRVNQELAKGLYSGLAKPRIDAINKFNPFSEIAELGSSLEFNAKDSKPLHVTLKVHGKDVLPKEKCSLLQSGKLSKKAFGVSEFNELHQDYVCSCAIRVAREVFSILTDDLVIVTALDNLLDKKTGHVVEAPVLSVAISRSTILGLNLDAIDPSDSMRNFVHNMRFKKTSGFEVVEVLDSAAFD